MPRPIRRHDLAPRLEMTPLIDVVFLLLTFFIYSLIVSADLKTLAVELAPLGSGQSPEPGRYVTLTVDRGGAVLLDREPVSDEALNKRLAAIADEPDPPVVLVAVEQQGQRDRAPVLLGLIERLQRAGVPRFELVGPPDQQGPAP